jgi:uncharacterized protein (TIRG00374 family)
MPLTLIFWGSLITFFFVLASFLFLAIKYAPHIGIQTLYSVDFRYILLAFVLFLLYHSFDMLRLRTIAKGFGIKYSYKYAYLTSFVATFGATVTPAHIGGELIIFYMLKRLGVKSHKIWGTILFKTVSGFSFFILAFPIFLIYTISSQEVLRKVLVLFAIFLVFSIVSLPLIRWFQRDKKNQTFTKRIKLYCLSVVYFWKNKKKEFIKACIYSVLLYITFLNFAPILMKAFHLNFNLWEVYLIQLPLIYAVFSSPTPGGSGVGEVGGVAIFQGIVPATILGLFVILWRFFSQYLGATIGGIIFLTILFKDLKENRKL